MATWLLFEITKISEIRIPTRHFLAKPRKDKANRERVYLKDHGGSVTGVINKVTIHIVTYNPNLRYL